MFFVFFFGGGEEVSLLSLLQQAIFLVGGFIAVGAPEEAGEGMKRGIFQCSSKENAFALKADISDPQARVWVCVCLGVSRQEGCFLLYPFNIVFSISTASNCENES